MARTAHPQFGFNSPSLSHTHTASGSTAAQQREASKPLSVMLLAGAMGALVAVADQVIDTWADGHLLAGWVAMWVVAFIALALMATPFHWASNAIARWVEASRTQRIEAQMWEYARHDPRVMEELKMAMARHHAEA